MKRRIRIIILLLSITIPIIIGVQALWIYNAYQINRKQLQKDINQSLQSAIQESVRQRMKGVTNFETSSNGSIKLTTIKSEEEYAIDSLLDQIVTHQDSGNAEFTFSFSTAAMDQTDENDKLPEEFHVNIKEIIQALMITEIRDTTNQQVLLIDSLVNEQLAQRSLHGNYRLESTQDTTRWTNTETPLKSRTFPLNLAQSTHIRLLYTTPVQATLKRMGANLIASLLLTLLAGFSFIYMLHTILRQKKLSEVKSDFINNMTHELKTPIATVSTAIEAMQHFGALNNKEKTQNYLKISSKELKRLSGLVEKVLNISRLEKRKIDLFKEQLSIKPIVAELMEKHTHATTKSISYNYFDEDENIPVMADKMHITNVLSNLIDNAVKYGSANPQIEFFVLHSPTQHHIAIKDNGPGIAKEHMKKIFDKFYRIPKGNTHDIKGFGLGLHYACNIIHQHGGELLVKNNPRKGSTFTIVLPRHE